MELKFNEIKFKELVLYISYKAEPKELGATKLNKILLYSDMVSYLDFGKPIVGETYIKRQYGPVPKHILNITEQLVASGDMFIRDINYSEYTKREYLPLREPNLSVFSPEEISIVDNFINIICYEHTATSISKHSHDRIWELAEIGEEIPYNTIFASQLGEIDEFDIQWAQRALLNIEKAE